MKTKPNIRDVYHRHRPEYDDTVVLGVRVGVWLHFVYGDAHQMVQLLGEPMLENADYPQVSVHESRRNEIDDRLTALGKNGEIIVNEDPFADVDLDALLAGCQQKLTRLTVVIETINRVAV